MGDRWRFSDLTREALRNVYGRNARLLPAVILAGVLGAGSVAILAVEQRSLHDEIDALSMQGRGVVSVSEASPERPARISRSSCENIVQSPGVQDAGIVIDAGRTSAAPFVVDAPASRASTTLFPELGAVDVLVGGTLVPREGAFRAFIHGQPFDAAVATGSREGTGTSFSLTFPLLPTDTAAARCVILLDPLVSAADVTAELVAQLDVRGNPVSAEEVLATPLDPIDDYLMRVGRFAPLALGILGGLVTAVITRTRTSELAVYRLSGTSRASLLTVLTLEHAIIGGTAAAVASVSSLVLAAGLLDPATSIVAGFALGGAWTLFATLVVADVPLRRPTDLAKDR